MTGGGRHTFFVDLVVWKHREHGFVPLINSARFLDMRAAPSNQGSVPSLLIRPGGAQKVCQLSTKPTSFAGHHLDNQYLTHDIQMLELKQ